MSRAARTLPHEFDDPFGTTADPSRYVRREASERALAELEQAVVDRESAALLVGVPGIGKTLVLRLLKRRLESRLTVIHLPYAALPPAALANWALSAMNAQSSWDPVGALATRAHHLYLESLGGVVLLIDDAEAMPEETVHALAQMVRDAKGGLRFVAAVDEESAGRLGAWLGNLVWVRMLTPMTPAETFQYVHTRLQGSGLPSRAIEAFDPDTLAALHERSGGIPGRVGAEASTIVLRALLPRTAARGPAPGETVSVPASEADRLMESLFADSVEASPPPPREAAEPEALAPPPDTLPESEALDDTLPRAPELVEAEEEELDDTLPRARDLLEEAEDELDDTLPDAGELDDTLPDADGPDPLLPAPEDVLPDSVLLVDSELPAPSLFDPAVPRSSLLDAELPESSLLDPELPDSSLLEPGRTDPAVSGSSERQAAHEREAGRRALARDVVGAPDSGAAFERAAGRLAMAHGETLAASGAGDPAEAASPLRRGAQALALVGACFVVGLVLGPRVAGWLSPEAAPLDEPAASAAEAPEAPAETAPAVAPAAAPVQVRVQINASPWAHIRIDGEEVGVTPLAGVPVEAGLHTFEARFSDGRVVERVQEIGPQSRWVVFR